jgi:hypothetical protein
MDMFNVKRRDNPSMDKHMDLKKPGFGGPNSKEDFDKSKRKSLDGYQRVIDRNADFEGGNFNHNYDPTWKAVTRDLISRTAKKKPFNPMYAKQTIATVNAVEEGTIKRFEQFVNENEGFNMFAEAEEETPEMEETTEMEETPEVDEEQVEMLMADFGDNLEEMIDEIAEKMELEKEAVCDILCAAIKKMCAPAEEEEEENEESEESEENEEEEENEA